MKLPVLIAAMLAAAPLAATAQSSLADKRLAITKGTATGKVLIEAPAPRAASAPTAATAASAAAATGEPPRKGWFSRLPPPSGRPMSAAQRLDAPDQGIVVKPAPAASAPR